MRFVSQSAGNPQNELAQKINHSFNLDELKGLCKQIGVDFENLGGGAKENIVDELIGYCNRRQLADMLLDALKNARPKVSWG